MQRDLNKLHRNGEILIRKRGIEINRRIMEFYNAESDVYLQNRPWMRSYILTNVVKFVSSFLEFNVKQRKRVRVLNVGCGPGWLERALDDDFLKSTLFVSLDVSVKMAKTTKMQSPYVEAVVASGENLPFRSGSFDVVISSRAIKFMKLQSFLDNVKTVLSDDGSFSVIFDCGDALWVRLLERAGIPVDVGINNRTLRTRELSSMLSSLGFDLFGLFPVTSLPLSIFSYVPRSLYTLLKRLDIPKVIGARINIICSRNR